MILLRSRRMRQAGTQHTWEGRNAHTGTGQKTRQRDLDIDGRIILKWWQAVVNTVTET